MTLGFAEAGFIGIGVQTTHGTVAARTDFIDVVSESITFQPVRVISPELGSAAPTINKELGVESGGSIEVIGDYDSELLDSLFKQIFGSVTSTAGANTNAFDHAFTLTSTGTASGFSIEVERDTAAFLYVNCKVNSVEMSQAPDDYTRFRFEILGGLEIIVTATSASFQAKQPMTNNDLSVEFDNTARTANNFTVTIARNMTQRMRLGTSARKEIQQAGYIDVTGSFEIDFEDTSRYQDFKNLTNVKIEGVWTGSTISGTSSYLHHVTMAQCNLEQGGGPVLSARGPITIPFSFRAFDTTRGALDLITLDRTNTNDAVA